MKQKRLLPRLLLQLLDSLRGPLRASRAEVDLRVVLEQGLRRTAMSVCAPKRVNHPRRTFTVSFPIPLFPPVTIITLPDRSGISSTLNVGAGGNISLKA